MSSCSSSGRSQGATNIVSRERARVQATYQTRRSSSVICRRSVPTRMTSSNSVPLDLCMVSTKSCGPSPNVRVDEVDGSKVHRTRSVSYTHLRAHETRHDLVCRLLLD